MDDAVAAATATVASCAALNATAATATAATVAATTTTTTTTSYLTLAALLRQLLVIVTTIICTCVSLAVYNRRLQAASLRAEDTRRDRMLSRRRRGCDSSLFDSSSKITRDATRALQELGKYGTSCYNGGGGGGGESTLLLGDSASGAFFSIVIGQMWQHLNVAVSDAIKETMEPMLKNLKVCPLHFVKLDLGDVPIRTENIFIHRVDLDQDDDGDGDSETSDDDDNDDKDIGRGGGGKPSGIQIDLDVVWDGDCDVMLQASLMNENNPLAKSVGTPKVTFGVKRIKLAGRMHILLSPLTTELPVVGAVQYGFTNPPDIRLEFGGVAQSIAKQFAFVQPAVLGCVQSSLASLLVLPMRMIMPLDLINYDYLDTYQPPAGMIRVTAVEGWGFTILKKMLLNDIPDIYCLISLGSSPPFRTPTRWDQCSPSWEDESCDFVLHDIDQKIYVEAYDDDPAPMLDYGTLLGKAEITVRDLFRQNGGGDGATAKLELLMNGEKKTGCFIKISADMFGLSNRLHSLSSLKYEGDNHMCGLVTIIVTKAFDIPLASKEEAASYVKVEYGGNSDRVSNTFLTPTVWFDLNPMYNGAFHQPLTTDMMKQDDQLDDAAMAAAMSFGSPGSAKSNPAAGGRRRPRSMPNTRMASSVLKQSMSTVAHAVRVTVHQPKKDSKKRNDIVFTLMNGECSNTNSHKKLGSFTVTHDSLVRAPGHTITERRPIGDAGASLEFRVMLSGMQSEDEKNAQSEEETLRQSAPQSASASSNEKRSIRVTALKGRGFLLSHRNLVVGKKNVVPDVYCYLRLNSSPDPSKPLQNDPSHPSCWRTSTVRDDTMPKWNEGTTFKTTDLARDAVRVDAYDERRAHKDTYLGSAEYPLEKLLRKRTMEVELRNGTELTGSFVTLKGAQVYTHDDVDENDDDSFNFEDEDRFELLTSQESRRLSWQNNISEHDDYDNPADDLNRSCPPGVGLAPLAEPNSKEKTRTRDVIRKKVSSVTSQIQDKSLRRRIRRPTFERASSERKGMGLRQRSERILTTDERMLSR